MGHALLVMGPEALIAERTVKAQIKAALAQVPGADVNQVAGTGLDSGTFTELTSGSLFSSESVVVIEDISMVSSDLFDQIVAAAKDPGPDLALILTHPGGVRGKGLVDKLKKAKVPTADAAAIKSWELPKFVTAEARRERVPLDGAAAQALVDALGSDVRALAAAVVQLGADHPDSTITADTVATYFGGRAEVTSFAVADDIMAGRQAQALEKLRWALDTGVAPVLVTSAVAGSLRGVGKYLDLRSTRASEADLAKQIGVPPWKIKDLARQARSWSPAAVAHAITVVARADGQIKGMASDPEYALEAMVLELGRQRSAGRGN